MGYKLLGYTVWRGGKWYLRRRFPNAGRNLAVAGGASLLLAAGAVAFGVQRRSNGE